MLSHGNLLSNASLIYRAVEHTPTDKYVSWLPTFHDMGFMAGVLQPLYGGLPVVLMEALALGVPVVAPCVAGIPELVEHGVSGLTFPPGDWATLARMLAQILADPELRQRTASEGKRRIEAEFFVEKSLDPLVAAFESVSARRAQLT